jgi:hypothetical protein
MAKCRLADCISPSDARQPWRQATTIKAASQTTFMTAGDQLGAAKWPRTLSAPAKSAVVQAIST